MKPDCSALTETLTSHVTCLWQVLNLLRSYQKTSYLFFLTCLFVLEKQRLEETSCLTSGLLAFCK